MSITSAESVTDQDVMITRIFDAPRTLLFQAWTTREHLERWFAPNGCATTFSKLDVREGGEFHSCVRIPGGHECWCIGVYHEIVTPERIVYNIAISDATGRRVNPVDVGMDAD